MNILASLPNTLQTYIHSSAGYPISGFDHTSESKTTKKETGMFFRTKFSLRINSYYN